MFMNNESPQFHKLTRERHGKGLIVVENGKDVQVKKDLLYEGKDKAYLDIDRMIK